MHTNHIVCVNFTKHQTNQVFNQTSWFQLFIGVENDKSDDDKDENVITKKEHFPDVDCNRLISSAEKNCLHESTKTPLSADFEDNFGQMHCTIWEN